MTLKAKLKLPGTKLIAAADEGDIPTLWKLLNDAGQRSPLHSKYLNKALIAVSSNENCKPGHSAAVKILLDQGAEIKCRDDEYCRAPLIWAVIFGQEDIVDILMKRRAQIDARDGKCDWTPLMWAVDS